MCGLLFLYAFDLGGAMWCINNTIGECFVGARECGGVGGKLLFDEFEVALQDNRRVALLCNHVVARVDGGEEISECFSDFVFVDADSGFVLEAYEDLELSGGGAALGAVDHG